MKNAVRAPSHAGFSEENPGVQKTPKESFTPKPLRSPSDPEGRKQVNVKLLSYKCLRKNSTKVVFHKSS